MPFLFGVADETFKLTIGNKRYIDNDGPAYEHKSIRLVAAKRDTAAFQLVMKSDARFVLNVSGQPVFSRKGDAEVFRLVPQSGGLPISLSPVGMMRDDNGTLYADVLLRYPTLEVEADTPVAVWVEITLPPETKAGLYHGSIELLRGRLFEDETPAGRVEFTLEVRDFLLPQPSDFTFHLDLWQHNSNIARQAETPLWSDAHFAAMEPVVESLCQIGQKAVTLIVSQIPWSGQRCFNERRTSADFYEYSIVGVTKQSGRFVYDFTAMQRYIDLCAKYGIDKEIELFGLANIWTEECKGFGGVAADYPDALRIRYLDDDGRYKYMKTAAEIDDYLRALEQYFIKTRQIDRVRVVADEPEVPEAYAKSLAHLRSVAPAFRFKAALNHTGFIKDFGKTVDDFAPIFTCLQQEYPDFRKLMAQYHEGKRYLWYVCCGPEHPNTLLHSPLSEGRLIGWMTDAMGLDGFLRWNYSCWTDKPREDIRYACWPAGDVNFIYPSGDGAPLLSLRWKALARGIQEYELLRLARLRGRVDAVAAAQALVFGETAESIGHLLDTDSARPFPLDGVFRGDSDAFRTAKTLLLDALLSD